MITQILYKMITKLFIRLQKIKQIIYTLLKSIKSDTKKDR